MIIIIFFLQISLIWACIWHPVLNKKPNHCSQYFQHLQKRKNDSFVFSMRVKTLAAQLNGKVNEWDDSKCEQKRSTWHIIFGLTVTDSSTPLDYSVISIAFLRLLQSSDKCSKDYDKILKLNTENTLIHLYIVSDSQRSQKNQKGSVLCVCVGFFFLSDVDSDLAYV